MDSKLITKIYNCEFEENTVIKIMLPAPKFITMANSNSVIENAKAYVQNIVEIFGSDMDDNEKAELTNLLMRHFVGTHVDIGAIDNMKSLAKVNVASKSTGQEEQ
jgi:ribosomal protein S13